MNRKFAVFAVIFPIVIMAAWFGSLYYSHAHGAKIFLNVRGFDPRDLLSGHYLRFSVDFGQDICEGLSSGESINTCVCINAPQPSVIATVSWRGACSQRNELSCPVFVKGTCRSGVFDAGIDRYYIPEKYSDKLQRVPQGATIEVRINTSGHAQVADFLVDGKSVLQSMKE